VAVQSSALGRDANVNWVRVGGLLGIGWLILFFIGAFALQGDTPSRDDSIASIREYFTDDGDTYLLGDYLIGIAFIVFFLPFLIILQRVLGRGEGWAGILSRVALFAGALAILWGGFAGTFWGALAVGAAENREVDDSAVRTLMELDSYAFAGLLFPVGLFMGAAGLSIWLSGVLWRWLGIIGIIGFLGSYIGAAWPIDGDDEGAVAAFGLAGFLGIAIFVLLVSINLMRLRNAGATEPGLASRPDV
jgi:hypothetical protein